jgi:O-antigen ligase
VLSLIWSADRLAGLEYLAKYRYLLLIPILATSLRPDFRSRVETAFLAGTALSLVVSYAVFAGLFRLRDAYPGNPAPSMSHLDYSMVLAVAGLIALTRLLEGGHTPWRQLAWAALVAFVAGGLLINIGRSGQVAFVGAALVVTPLILLKRSRRAAAAGLAAVVVLVAGAYLAVEPFRSRVLDGVHGLEAAVLEGRYDSNQGKRVAGAIVALDMVRERPLLGTGVGGTMERFRELLAQRHPDLQAVASWLPHLHNQYLQTVTETGLIGLATLLGMMVVLILGPHGSDHARHLGVLLAVSYLLGFLGDPFLHKQLPLVLFAMVAGLAAAPSCCRKRPTERSAAGVGSR